ncbi:hypothetical protein ACFCW6_10820 [Streptomyces sp. NPDC056333]|uniref:hypothetical protein n=1 Tax=Streptomyces sp. NPDC056333 TaxID=3345786 RepID=UPI0035DDC60D
MKHAPCATSWPTSSPRRVTHLPADIVPDGGFDAILVTVDAWDLPWIDALTDGGRLVAPLRLHGYHWAIGFTRHDRALRSDEPLIVCGLVAMQGDGVWNANRRTVPGTGVHLSWEDGAPLPVDQLAPALTREPTVAHAARPGRTDCVRPLLSDDDGARLGTAALLRRRTRRPLAASSSRSRMPISRSTTGSWAGGRRE